MRLGVIDVGSNTVHLLVVDASYGAHPMPESSYKLELRLSEHVLDDGRISDDGRERLITFVNECIQVAEDKGCAELLAFATSAIREAPNGHEVLQDVSHKTGVELRELSGDMEAKLTFLAVRRWFGWSSGKLLVIDIGGGSLEIAIGMDEEPDIAISLPLGAGRITRDWLPGDPPSADDIKAARKYVRAQIGTQVGRVKRAGVPNHVVGTSKTMRSLGRINGAAPSSSGPFIERTLTREGISKVIAKVSTMTAAERATLSGVSHSRAAQLLAGAIVAEAAMDLLGVEKLEIGPWALREGVILRYFDMMSDPSGV
ncbi:Ppx/GppA phosphatase family protein [Kribbia dieselivorans]|uniref:Ppx/GppA phosphatase family protein n=1 Tax=Kribbia dieselivorans TaxID=331526 RepID=UPI000838E474|nr:Ppx/GppA phosphatase family protein [Kribbia dieselivorans]